MSKDQLGKRLARKSPQKGQRLGVSGWDFFFRVVSHSDPAFKDILYLPCNMGGCGIVYRAFQQKVYPIINQILRK